MSDQMLAEVHAMLSAQLKASSMVTIINGWTLFQNSDAGPYVGLYNTFKGKRDGRVYVYGFESGNEQRPLSVDFKKLPQWLQDMVLASLAKEQPPEAPRSETTEYIQQKKLLHECRAFKVVRYKYGMFNENGEKVEKKADDKKDPWRIEKCFDIGGQRQPQQSTGQSPTQQPTAQQPASQQPNGQPTQQPTAQPSDRTARITAMFKEAKTVYGEAGAQSAVIKIAREVAGRDIKASTELSETELTKVVLIVNLDFIGINNYKDVQKWYKRLNGLVSNYRKQTVYEMTIPELEKLRNQVMQDIPF